MADPIEHAPEVMKKAPPYHVPELPDYETVRKVASQEAIEKGEKEREEQAAIAEAQLEEALKTA